MDDLFNASPNLGDSPDGTQLPQPASTGETELERGLRALHQREYETAIAYLEAALPTTPDLNQRLKAQVSLVKAYAAVGQRDRALSLCQELQSSPNPKVAQWATQTLPGLQPSASATGNPSVSDPGADATGFVPLSPLPSGTGDQTGFTPLNPASATQRRERIQLTSSTSPSLPTQPSPPITPVTNPSPTDSAATQPEPAAREFTAPAQSTPRTTPHSEPQAPLQSDSQVPTETSRVAQAPVWRQAGRAQRWGKLGAIDRSKLWGVAALTAIAPITAIWAILWLGRLVVNQLLLWFTWPLDLRQFLLYGNIPLLAIALLVVIGFATAPLGLGWVLRSTYGAKPLSQDLLTRYSPEAPRLLKRICGQHRYPIPQLKILYIQAPVIFTCGNLRRNAQIVVSQGLLEQLEDDEIATVIAAQLGHLQLWDFAILSGLIWMAQVPYLIYWNVAAWSDRQSNPVFRSLGVGVSAMGYGLFWLMHNCGLWLSRARLYYSDRIACELTGNPNGLSRALLKISLGLSKELQRQGHTPPLLESFDLLMPQGYRSALTLGSVCFYTPLEPLLQRDIALPYRKWLAIGMAHPPTGDRLRLLSLYARHWKLESELELATPPRSMPRPRTDGWLRQIAPFIGGPVGGAIALLLWLIGAVAAQLRWWNLSWMQGDNALFWGFILVGASVGILLRINPFFPDIRRSQLPHDAPLPELLNPSLSLPIHSQPVQLQGKLLGRKGIGNTLAVDLYLQHATGLIRLHHTSPLGAVGTLVPESPRPLDWINRPVVVTGWLRQGIVPWVDIETLRLQQGKTAIRSGHPLWATFLAFATAFLGAFLIFRG